MNIFKRLLKDTFIYGLANVLPRLMNLTLVSLHTAVLLPEEYSENSSFYIYAAFANVILTYGMETAFFRFYNKEKNNPKVFSTVLISLIISTLVFFITTFCLKHQISLWLKIPLENVLVLIGVSSLDTLCVAAFVLYRIQGKAIKFAVIKIVSLAIFIILNFFFLWGVPRFNIQLPIWLQYSNVLYIVIANLVASGLTFCMVLPTYLKYNLKFDYGLLKRLLNYGWPIMVSGIAFVINENLDKLILRDFLGKETMGAYSGCYKLTVFLTLFIAAFRMGVEPLIFNQADNKNAKQTYTVVLKFFVIFASLGLLFVIAFLDLFKELLIRNEDYWFAIQMVPIVLLANWCLGVYHSLSVWYKVTDRTHFGMYISIFGAIITIVVNYIFVPIYGFIAAAYATLAAYGSMMFISYFLGQHYYSIPYNIKRLSSYLFTSIILSTICLYIVPEIFAVKVIAILVYLAIIVIFEKNSVQSMLKR